MACWVFLVLTVSQWQKYIKSPGFDDNAHLCIRSIYLRLDMFSLTEFSICRLNQVKAEHIPMKV